MQGMELRMIAAGGMAGPNAGRWPTAHGDAYRRDSAYRHQAMRARAREAEMAARDRQAWEASRSVRDARPRPAWHVPAVAGACVCLVVAVLVTWVLPMLATHAP